MFAVFESKNLQKAEAKSTSQLMTKYLGNELK